MDFQCCKYLDSLLILVQENIFHKNANVIACVCKFYVVSTFRCDVTQLMQISLDDLIVECTISHTPDYHSFSMFFLTQWEKDQGLVVVEKSIGLTVFNHFSIPRQYCCGCGCRYYYCYHYFWPLFFHKKS